MFSVYLTVIFGKTCGQFFRGCTKYPNSSLLEIRFFLACLHAHKETARGKPVPSAEATGSLAKRGLKSILCQVREADRGLVTGVVKNRVPCPNSSLFFPYLSFFSAVLLEGC